jgi:folate-binding protein YgfZ
VNAASGYSALREHAAWIDLSARGKIRVSGEDRARLLHAMTTNHVDGLKPGEGCYTFFLNAQGRILGDANLLCFDDHILIDTEPETRQKLYEHLDRYIIADDATLEDATDRIVTIAIEGPEAAEVLAKLGAPIPEAEYSHIAWGDVTIAKLNSTGSSGFFLFMPADQKSGLTARMGITEASSDDARAVRIEHGKPRYGEEITERYLVQETGQLQAVHFSKGCYLGQEIVERVRSRAQIHRVLRRLEIETKSAPEVGTKLKSGDTDAGEIVTAAYSPALEKSVAMAYVRVAFAEPSSELAIDGARAIVMNSGT